MPRSVESAALRSWIMSRVRARDTTPELQVRKELFRRGYRFRVNAKHLPGRPDIVMARRRIAIFVHGCFWHSHNCARGKRPLTNQDFWNNKLDQNRQRDRLSVAALKKAGWRVLVIWECRLRKGKL